MKLNYPATACNSCGEVPSSGLSLLTSPPATKGRYGRLRCSGKHRRQPPQLLCTVPLQLTTLRTLQSCPAPMTSSILRVGFSARFWCLAGAVWTLSPAHDHGAQCCCTQEAKAVSLMVKAAPTRVLFLACLVSAPWYSALAVSLAGEGVASPAASLLSQVRCRWAIPVLVTGKAHGLAMTTQPPTSRVSLHASMPTYGGAPGHV